VPRGYPLPSLRLGDLLTSNYSRGLCPRYSFELSTDFVTLSGVQGPVSVSVVKTRGLLSGLTSTGYLYGRVLYLPWCSFRILVRTGQASAHALCPEPPCQPTSVQLLGYFWKWRCHRIRVAQYLADLTAEYTATSHAKYGASHSCKNST
jgi:hypothetical protein